MRQHVSYIIGGSMKVVLDANIFCRDLRLSSTNFRVFRDGLHLVPGDLKIPEVVVDEVVNCFREDLSAAVSGSAKAASTLGRLLPQADQPPGIEIDEAAQVREYREWLLSTLDAMGAAILPYPNIPHKTVVQRDLERKQPFKKGGAGYRDFLIWESVRRLMIGGLERVVLVTANKKDFGEGPGVADDLAKDILNPNRIEVVQTLESFNEAFIIPKLAMVDEMKERLEAEAGFLFDIPRWLKENLVDTLKDEDYLESYVLGFPDGVGGVRAKEVISLKSFVVDEVLQLNEEEVLVRVKVQVEALFGVDVDWDDYINNEEVQDFVGSTDPFDSLWTDHVDTLTLGFNFVLDSTGKHLIESELGSIDGPCASADWGSW